EGGARRGVRGLSGFFDRAGKSISEDDERPGGLAVRQWLEHHVVAALGQRRAIPRAVEGDERTALVGSGELTPVIKQEVVGRPMPGKRRDGCSLVGTRPDRFPAVAAVFRGKHELVLGKIALTLRPALLASALTPH